MIFFPPYSNSQHAGVADWRDCLKFLAVSVDSGEAAKC